MTAMESLSSGKTVKCGSELTERRYFTGILYLMTGRMAMVGCPWVYLVNRPNGHDGVPLGIPCEPAEWP